jgi:PPM family protein phosphatase
MEIACAGQSHVGRRHNNEDNFLVEAELRLFAVADGMGGYEGGEIASRLAVDSLRDFFRRNADDEDATWPFKLNRALSLAENLVSTGVRCADLAVRTEKNGHLHEMGSTVAVLYLETGRAVIGHLGDSRIYLWRGGELQQLTIDHSLYEQFRAAGDRELPPLENFAYANVITRALGIGENSAPELRSVPLLAGDRLLLCTDGLSGALPGAAIGELLATGSVEVACGALVEQAFARGSKDNITAVVVELSAC